MDANLYFNWLNFFLLGTLFIVSSSIFTLLISCKKSKNLPPGPKALPIIGHFHLLKRPLHKTLHELSKKYGDVMFLQFGIRKVVVVSSPKAAEECFTKNDIVLADRPQTIAGKLLNYNSSTVALSSYGDHWRNLRRIMTIEMFSQSRLAGFTSIRQEEVLFLLKELSEESRDLKPIKVKAKLSNFTLNIMMRMMAGKRYYGKDVTNNEEAKRFQEVISELVVFHGTMHCEDYIPFLKLFDMNGLKKKMMIFMKKMDSLLQNLVDEHRRMRSVSTDQPSNIASNKKQIPSALIDVLVSLQDTEPQFLTDTIIKSIVQSLLVGGTETTSSTLEWAMSLLLNNPDAMKKALAEIETHVGRDRMIDESDIPKLNYLNNVVTETLRLCPPLPLLIPHTAAEDCSICGYEVPKGTMILTNVWTIQRDPKLWDEPEKFKPERFDGKEGTEGYKLLPFGAGRRACPGANLGRRVIALTLGALLQSFEMEKVGEMEINMMEGHGLAMSKAKPLEILFKPRKIGINSSFF